VKQRYHRQITTQALQAHVSAPALESIVVANLGQDALRYQFRHDYFHYDNNSFQVADAYVIALRQQGRQALKDSQPEVARQCFGRLSHAVQDFYAHSNYVFLWREAHPDVAAGEIAPESSQLLAHSRLHSGRLYYPLEAFSFLPALNAFVLPFLPRDSHAWMNLDGPERPGFDLAFQAALGRTRAEYFRFLDGLPTALVEFFNGQDVL
jgi:hypothetical protein